MIMAPYNMMKTGLILGLHSANERQCYFVIMSLIGWTQTQNQPCEKETIIKLYMWRNSGSNIIRWACKLNSIIESRHNIETLWLITYFTELEIVTGYKYHKTYQ